jgi:hypothetical protein
MLWGSGGQSFHDSGRSSCLSFAIIQKQLRKVHERSLPPFPRNNTRSGCFAYIMLLYHNVL